MVEHCICDVEDTLEFYDREGLPSGLCNTACTQLFTPQSLYTSEGLEYDPSIVNFEKSKPDVDSLCHLLGDKRIEDFCRTCDSEQLFIGVSAEDKSLKEIGENFSRERCSNSEAGYGESVDNGYCSFEGLYIFDGYNSILRGVFQVGSDDLEKMIKSFVSAVTVTTEPNPPSLKLRIGISHQPLDSNPSNPFIGIGNGGDCEVTWHLQKYISLECPAIKTASQQVSERLRNVRKFIWPLHRRGRFLHYELSVVGWNGTVETPAIGGDATFTSLTIESNRQKV